MTCKSKMQFSTVAGWNERTNEPYSSLLGLSKRGPRFSFHLTLLLPLRLTLIFRGRKRSRLFPPTLLHIFIAFVGQFISHLHDFPFFFDRSFFVFLLRKPSTTTLFLFFLYSLQKKKPRSLHPTQVSRISTSILPGNPWVVRISDTRSYFFIFFSTLAAASPPPAAQTWRPRRPALWPRSRPPRPPPRSAPARGRGPRGTRARWRPRRRWRTKEMERK